MPDFNSISDIPKWRIPNHGLTQEEKALRKIEREKVQIEMTQKLTQGYQIVRDVDQQINTIQVKKINWSESLLECFEKMKLKEKQGSSIRHVLHQ